MKTTDTIPADTVGISWRDAHASLRQFISLTPSISIDSNNVSIPSDVKEGFYHHFDIARTSFVREYCPTVTECGLELSQQYKSLRTSFLQETKLDRVETSTDLAWFLEDSIDGIRRFLFKPLLSLLANQVTIEEFEQTATDKINGAFSSLFREGYQRWVALSIVRQLLPDKSYRFPVMDAIHDGLIGEGHEKPGQHTDDVPGAQEIDYVSFEQHPVISFIAPRIAIHSRRTNAFVSLNTGFREAEWTARQRSQNMEWQEIAAIKSEHNLSKIRPDLFKKDWYELEPVLPDMTFYSASEVDDLSLVADFKYMLCPETSIIVMESSDWHEKITPEEIKRHLFAMRPRRGAFIVCRQEIPDAVITALSNESGLKLIHAGYNEDALETIVNLLSPPV